MTNERLRDIQSSLQEIDENSENEQLTYKILTLIKENPRVDIDHLKLKSDIEPETMKSLIPQLSELGLVFRLTVGYALSPLGKHLLNEVKSK